MDLDFFVHGVVHWPDLDAGRASPAEHVPWELDDVFGFLTTRCGLSSKLPGRAVETHDEVFGLWRDSVQAGQLETPFHVTHVDAHGDLGFGDASYVYLLTELLFEEPENRSFPKTGGTGLGESNYLAFAIACRWVSDLAYVFNEGGGSDVFPYYREGFDRDATGVQLVALTPAEWEFLKQIYPEQRQAELQRFRESVADRLEPLVPVKELPWKKFRAEAPFDAVFLARSPAYTPLAADLIYDEIRRRFIDEDAELVFGDQEPDP